MALESVWEIFNYRLVLILRLKATFASVMFLFLAFKFFLFFFFHIIKSMFEILTHTFFILNFLAWVDLVAQHRIILDHILKKFNSKLAIDDTKTLP